MRREFIIVYGRNEVDTVENKENFLKTLQKIKYNMKQEVVILGDQNVRAIRNVSEWRHVIGPNGEYTLNDNGKF